MLFDRGRLLVGQPGLTSGGEVHVLDFDAGSDQWVPTTTFTASDVSDHIDFGKTLASDGDRLIVGAQYGTGHVPNTGAVYVFERDASLVGWAEVQKLAPTSGHWIQGYGSDLAIDGELLVVAAPFRRELLLPYAGAFHTYRLDAGSGLWVETDRVRSPAPREQASFSRNIGFEGGRLLVSEWNAALREIVHRYEVDANGARFVGTLDVAGDLGSDIEVDGDNVLMSDQTGDPVTMQRGRVLAFDFADLNTDGELDACQQLGTPYCGPAVPHSGGGVASLRAVGSEPALVLGLDLVVSDLPGGSVGYVIVSATQGATPGAGGSVGTLCLAGAIGRYVGSVLVPGANGAAQMHVDPGSIAQPTGAATAMSGEVWNFQYYFRAPGETNFSNGVAVTF